MCPVESEADRAVFTNPADFGVNVLYKVAGAGAGVTVPGILDLPPSNADLAEGVALEDFKPRFLFSSALIATPAEGDTITVAGVVYTVRGIRHDRSGPDGTTGMTELMMEKQ